MSSRINHQTWHASTQLRQQYQSMPRRYSTNKSKNMNTRSGVAMRKAAVAGVRLGRGGCRRTTPPIMVAWKEKACSVMISTLLSLAGEGGGCSGSSEASSSVGLPKSMHRLAYSDVKSLASSHCRLGWKHFAYAATATGLPTWPERDLHTQAPRASLPGTLDR